MLPGSSAAATFAMSSALEELRDLGFEAVQLAERALFEVVELDRVEGAVRLFRDHDQIKDTDDPAIDAGRSGWGRFRR